MGPDCDYGIEAAHAYAELLQRRSCAREDAAPLSEFVLQRLWHEQRFRPGPLESLEGHCIEVGSPGWWNAHDGPDFKNARITFNGVTRDGDVEVHLAPGMWYGHGHHADPAYDNVMLHVVLKSGNVGRDAVTSQGRTIPTLALEAWLEDSIDVLAAESGPQRPARTPGKCAALIPMQGNEPLLKTLDLAGEWRLLHRVREIGERALAMGTDQAIYEAFLYACGFSPFKYPFRQLARNLPYDRAKQLVQLDPLLLECALLQLGGLLPNEVPESAPGYAHHTRLLGLRDLHLAELRSLGIEWPRTGVRPNNAPERRLAGAARVIARTAAQGLWSTLRGLWLEKGTPLERRKRFEAILVHSTGFWATHTSWQTKPLAQPTAPLGLGRARSIIGNALIPAAVSFSRAEGTRQIEEHAIALFRRMPAEPTNHVTRRMLSRVMGSGARCRLNFQRQQGLLQLYQDWCEPNPSCEDCTMFSYLDCRACQASTQAMEGTNSPGCATP